jgi:hypothetical protein
MYGASITLYDTGSKNPHEQAKRTLRHMGQALRDFGMPSVKGSHYLKCSSEPGEEMGSVFVILPEGQEDDALEAVRQAMLKHEPGVPVEKTVLVEMPVVGVAYGSTPQT